MTRARVNKLETMEALPNRLSAKQADTVERTWRSLQNAVAGRNALHGLPPYAEAVAEILWATTSKDVMLAMQRGDVAFFVAMMARLDTLNDGLIRAGRSIAQRAGIVNAKWVVEGFRMTAEANLQKLGGAWPPGSDWGEGEVSRTEPQSPG